MALAHQWPWPSKPSQKWVKQRSRSQKLHIINSGWLQWMHVSKPVLFPKQWSTGLRNSGGRASKYPALNHEYFHMSRYLGAANCLCTKAIILITLFRWKSWTSREPAMTQSEIRLTKTSHSALAVAAEGNQDICLHLTSHRSACNTVICWLRAPRKSWRLSVLRAYNWRRRLTRSLSVK